MSTVELTRLKERTAQTAREIRDDRAFNARMEKIDRSLTAVRAVIATPSIRDAFVGVPTDAR